MPCVQWMLRPSALLTVCIVVVASGVVGCAELKSRPRNDDAMILGKIEEPETKLAKKSGLPSAPVSAAYESKPIPPLGLEGRLDNPRLRPAEGPTIVANRTTAELSPKIKLGKPLSIDLPVVNVEPPAPGSLVAIHDIAVSKPRELKVQPAAITPETLVAAARQRVESLASYKVEMNRQERIGDNLLPVEHVILSVKRNPKAVRFEWPSGPSKGREVIFASADGQMHINTPGSLIQRLDLSPDNPLVARNSRHPITEAGFDTIIANLEAALVGPPQTRSRYEGKETPEILGRPCHKLTRSGPQGQRWLVYLDDQTKLPALVQEESAQGELLERYIFRNVQANPTDLALANAFDPDQRWGKSGGLLSRIARGPGSSENPANAAPATTR